MDYFLRCHLMNVNTAKDLSEMRLRFAKEIQGLKKQLASTTARATKAEAEAKASALWNLPSQATYFYHV